MAEPTMRKVRVWAVVTPRGRLKVDTICADRESAEFFVTEYDTEVGNKLKRVTLTYEIAR